jgi:hypothetical protein
MTHSRGNTLDVEGTKPLRQPWTYVTDSAIAARIVNALESTADREAGAKTALVSVTIDMLAGADAGAIEAHVVRKTRTLLFVSAEFTTDAGAKIATASSVHKIPG